VTYETPPAATGAQPPAADTEMRQRWMRTLAGAETDTLAAAWEAWAPKPEVEAIRGPELGLVMVRSRIDAGGAKFNLGEATVSRATVRLHGDAVAGDMLGTAYVLGTDLEHARLAAIFDGLLADAAHRERVLSDVVAPIERQQAERDTARRAEARSTLVDFFTVSREHE
jgi:alpha-D-ribose 1-methylphosphonate 5-triphosphate synthase subunit PhnG